MTDSMVFAERGLKGERRACVVRLPVSLPPSDIGRRARLCRDAEGDCSSTIFWRVDVVAGEEGGFELDESEGGARRVDGGQFELGAGAAEIEVLSEFCEAEQGASEVCKQ